MSLTGRASVDVVVLRRLSRGIDGCGYRFAYYHRWCRTQLPYGRAGNERKRLRCYRKETSMSIIQVGLVDKTGAISAELMQAVASSLTVQVTRDLPQFWNVQASVTYLPNAAKVPPGVWPVFLVKKLPPDEGGFHLDKH